MVIIMKKVDVYYIGWVSFHWWNRKLNETFKTNQVIDPPEPKKVETLRDGDCSVSLAICNLSRNVAVVL